MPRIISKQKTLAFSEHISDNIFFLISDVLTYQRISNSKYQISGSKCHISYQTSAFSEHISDTIFLSYQTHYHIKDSKYKISTNNFSKQHLNIKTTLSLLKTRKPNLFFPSYLSRLLLATNVETEP